jgi:hypothetical protein
MKNSLDSKFEELHRLIIKEGKRDGKIEKKQIEILYTILGKLKSYYGKKVEIDYTRFNTKIHENWYRIDQNGVIKKGDYKDCGNKWYDSKTFDAIIDLIIGNKEYSVFFVLKSAQVAGGTQDYAIKEIGQYSKSMQKNTDENLHFVFVLDGEYINSEIDKLDKSDKYETCTSETLENSLKSFINSKL